MKISKLYIENFRSIKRLELKLSQICALIGPNNAGKSNILLAIHRVLGRDWVSVGVFDENDVYGRNPASDVKIATSFSPALQYCKFKGADPADIETLSFEYTRYKIGEQKGQRRLEQKCFDAKGKPPMVLAKALKAGEKAQFQPLVNIPSEVRENVPLIYIGTNRSLKEHLPGARYSLLRQLFEDINKDLHDPKQTVKVRQSDGAEVDVPRAQHFNELMCAALSVLRTEEFDKLETAIKRNALRLLGFDPKTDADKLDFYFSPFDTIDFYKSMDMRVREGEFSISATELGEGIQNALVLSILQAFEERRKQGAILLIEEPEMFLHPQMQRTLYKTIREIGKTNQVIYTTHSPHFVTIPDYSEVVIVRRGTDGTTTRLSDLPINEKRREKFLKELDPERNELFFATRLLLVEGDTEKLALPEYAKHLNLDIDRAGASIVEVGGKKNIIDIANISISFGIPTGILYDTDCKQFKDEKDKENEFNKQIGALAKADGSVTVWPFPKDYETLLRETLSEKKYQELCQKFPGVSKPTQARLIASEKDQPVPKLIQDALNWLANKTEK